MWASHSVRHEQLPDNWPEIRTRVLVDAGWICEIGWSGCLTKASDVDHVHRGNDHSRRNLRAACSWCHGRKTSAEGNARKRELRALRRRPQERHPGQR